MVVLLDRGIVMVGEMSVEPQKASAEHFLGCRVSSLAVKGATASTDPALQEGTSYADQATEMMILGPAQWGVRMMNKYGQEKDQIPDYWAVLELCLENALAIVKGHNHNPNNPAGGNYDR